MRPDRLYVFKIDGVQFYVVVKRIFSYEPYAFGDNDAFKCRTVVKRIFLDFLNTVGNDDFRNRHIAVGGFVFVVVVLGNFNRVIRRIKTERVRADIQNAFVVGNYDFAAQPLIRHEHTIFDDERIFDFNGNGCHCSKFSVLFHAQLDKRRTFFQPFDVAFLVNRSDFFNRRRERYGVFIRGVPRLYVV